MLYKFFFHIIYGRNCNVDKLKRSDSLIRKFELLKLSKMLNKQEKTIRDYSQTVTTENERHY
jgi:hypothetical protein